MIDYSEYITAELYVLIPILYVIGAFIKNSKIKDWKIPLILGCTGILLAGIWVFATNPVADFQQALSMVFASITQGILCAAASVYTNNIYKQLSEKNSEATEKSVADTDQTVG